MVKMAGELVPARIAGLTLRLGSPLGPLISTAISAARAYAETTAA